MYVHILLYMGAKVTERFKAALTVATASLRDVAQGIERHYRGLHQYKRGERRVTLGAARALLRYLRNRSQELADAADRLEAAIHEEEGDDE